MKLGYKYLNNFLVNSSRANYTHYFDSEITVDFEDYVKSQVHFPLLYLMNRDMKEYLYCLQYLSGDLTYHSSFLKVIQYYYEDMANIMFNCFKYLEPSKIIISNDFPNMGGLSLYEFDLEEVKKNLELALSGKLVDLNMYYEVLDDFTNEQLSEFYVCDTLAVAVLCKFVSKSVGFRLEVNI